MKRVAVAIMAKARAAGAVKTRLTPPLTAARAAQLYRCFLLDKIDQVRTLEDTHAVVAYTPSSAGRLFEALAPGFYRLWPALARGARVAIVDVDKPTQDHGTPPALLRCELASLGYRQVDFISLASADGFLAVFTPPETLGAPGSIRPCTG